MAHRSGFAPPGMRPLRHCLMVALICLLLGAHTVQAQACPSVVTKARARATSKFAIIKMRVALPKGTPYVDNAAIKVTLPQGVSPVVSTRISSSQKGATRAILPYANGVNVYFTGLRLRKSITIQIKAKLLGCTLPSVLAFGTLFYQEDAQGNVTCHVPGTLNAPVKYSKNLARFKTGCTTPSPTFSPSVVPFIPYGVGQRCLENGQLAPWTRRQLDSNGGRDLADIISNPEQCWQYCSIHGSSSSRFFFNWQMSSNQCFCCGDVCTLVVDPEYTAYLSQRAFNTTGSRRRLLAEGATASVAEAKEHARKAADERFRRYLLSTGTEGEHPDSTSVTPGHAQNVDSEASANGKVAIVTFLTEAPEAAYNPLADYETIYPITSASLRRYAERHGYELIIHREPYNERKQAYWHKMEVIKVALDAGFEWVLYTDIDVLILDYDRPLEDFMVDRTIVTVNEWNARGLNQSPRSGFLLLRNGPRAYEFLDAWARSFEFYEEIEDPEQSSLETMFETAIWSGDFYLHEWSDFHSYDTSPYGLKAFSMHFPGKLKVYRVAKTWLYLNTVDGHWFDSESEEGKLTTYAASLLREHLAHYSEPAIRLGLTPHAEDKAEVEKCLRKAVGAGYAVDRAYNLDYHAYIELYMVLDAQLRIPTVIFITVPDKEEIPASVQANIQSWRDANPGFDVVVHDDDDLEILVELLLPELQAAWPSLLKVQQADVYRFLVTTFLGGVYADSDTICKRPIMEWVADRPRGLIVGVEAQNIDTTGTRRHEGDRTVVFSQYAFATGAFHPVLIRMLHRIMDGEEGLLAAASPSLTPKDRLRAVLRTTGPTAWTDVAAEYLCYAKSGQALTPDVFWGGGRAPALHILPISAFGANQTHSGAPSADDADVFVLHKFKGSTAFSGEKWMTATE